MGTSHGTTLPICPDHGPRWRMVRNAPVVAVLAAWDGRVLLGRRAREPFQGSWELPGGYVELAEHPTDAARREFREEIGLEVVLTGLVATIFVTRIFRLPPVELSGRVNVWYGAIFVLAFLGALVRGSLIVAAQVLDFRRQPGTAIIAVPMITDDDLIMTHTGVTASLIPGSLIVETDRDRRILYLHVIGVRNARDVERQRASVQTWERRIVMAVGSRAQVAAVRADAASRTGGAS